MNEDVSDDRVRQAQLEQLHRLSNVGGGWYDARSGWTFDQELLTLVGVETADQLLNAIGLLVVEEDRSAVLVALHEVLNAGGRRTVQCRLHHGRTGELRYVTSSCEAMVDADGRLLRAVLMHNDITDAVVARERAVCVKTAAAQARTQLLRRVSDALATDTGSVEQLMDRFADLAAACGDGATLRVLTADGLGVERELISHPDVVIKARIAEFLRSHSEQFDPTWGLHGEVLATGKLLSSIGNPHWRSDLEQRVDPESIRPDVDHFVYAPVRHAGSVLGFLHVFRSDPAPPYEPGDEDLVQVLADRVGAAIAQDRVAGMVEQQLVVTRDIERRLTELTYEQCDLLDHLGDVEERERAVLAEAIHDDPMQLIVAAMLQINQFHAELPADQGIRLDKPTEMLEAAVAGLRALLIALIPPNLAEGLTAAVRDLAKATFLGTNTRVEVVGLDRVRLTPGAAGTVYRILREGLINARKHAYASNVTVYVKDTTTEGVIVRITDDGVGSNFLDAGPGHIGLSTMRSRAASEGGQLHIRSTAGAGTIIELQLPQSRSE